MDRGFPNNLRRDFIVDSEFVQFVSKKSIQYSRTSCSREHDYQHVTYWINTMCLGITQ